MISARTIFNIFCSPTEVWVWVFWIRSSPLSQLNSWGRDITVYAVRKQRGWLKKSVRGREINKKQLEREIERERERGERERERNNDRKE